MGTRKALDFGWSKSKAVVVGLTVCLAATVVFAGGFAAPSVAQEGYHLCETYGSAEGLSTIKIKEEDSCSSRSLSTGGEIVGVFDEIGDNGEFSDCVSYSYYYLESTEDICEYIASYKAYRFDDLWEDLHYPEGEVEDDTILCWAEGANGATVNALISSEFSSEHGCVSLLNSYTEGDTTEVVNFGFFGNCGQADLRDRIQNACTEFARVITTSDWDQRNDYDCIHESEDEDLDFDGVFVKTYCRNP